ncbi:Os06g0621950, partial [Oryza sativa Japonica Group]
ELLAFEGLREHPVRRRDAVGDDRAAPPAGDLERQRLAAEVGVALPVLAPVPPHRDPPGPRPFHLHRRHLPVRRHVRDQHLQEAGAAGDGEPHPPCPLIVLPPELHRHNVGLGLGDAEERGLRHLEVLLGEVAPAAVVVGESEVGRAEVGGRHHHRRAAAEAPQHVVHAPHLVAAAARAAAPEQRAAHAGGV